MAWTAAKIGGNIAKARVAQAIPGPLNRSSLPIMPNKIKGLRSYIRRSAIGFGACVVILGLATAACAQWNEQVLYSFQGLPDGAGPTGRIVFDRQGNLYGVTSEGGSSSCAGPAQCGTVYELSPPTKNGAPWTETILHVFQGRAFGDGSTPSGGPVMDAAGNLYGTAAYDGTGPCRLLGGLVGCGVIYEMSPPAQPGGAWTETVLYNFQGGNDGYFPAGDLVFDKAGNLYGATVFGGGRGVNCGNSLDLNCGTIFELSPPQQKGGAWTEKVLYSFGGIQTWSSVSDGAQPNGGLVFDEAGDIYGTTAYGGSGLVSCGLEGLGGCGTTFELIPPKEKGGAWTENILHFFQGTPTDGARPNGDVILVDGALYGTTVDGGGAQVGIAYSLARANNRWVKATLYVFSGDPSPNNPGGGLTITKSGDVLGAAGSGGADFAGALFRLTPPKAGGGWGLQNLYSFAGPPSDAGLPYGNLVSDGGDNLYGISQVGGTGQACHSGCGAVFAVSP